MFKVPVVKPEWFRACKGAGRQVQCSALPPGACPAAVEGSANTVLTSRVFMCFTQLPFTGHLVGPFEGLKVCATGLIPPERTHLKNLVTNGGGEFSPSLTKDCTHLVCLSPCDPASKKLQCAPSPPLPVPCYPHQAPPYPRRPLTCCGCCLNQHGEEMEGGAGGAAVGV